MKKLFLTIGLISTQVMSADLIFKNGFDNDGLVSGTVTNLNTNGLTLNLSSETTQENLVITHGGFFTFDLEIPIGSLWTVSIQSQPSNPCSISNNSGTMTSLGYNNVQVTCTDSVNNWNVMNWNQGNWQ